MPEAAADLIIEGRVATLRGRAGLGLVEAIAIRSGRIIGAGTRRDLRMLDGATTSHWCLPYEHVVLPSLTDAHLHLTAAARAARQPELTGLDRRAVAESIAHAHHAMLERGDADGWLLGHGWTFAALGDHPHASWLDAAAPGRRVALWAHDHHARWLSHAAMVAGGLLAAGDPPGGHIERGADSQPTGVMYESAAGLIDAVIPVPDEAWTRAAITDYAQALAVLGVTSVHDPGDLAPDPALRGGPVRYRAMAEGDRLPLRVMASIREEQLERAIDIGMRSGRAFGPPGRARYRDGWLKLFADGALG